MDESQELAAADAKFAALTIAKLAGFLHAAGMLDKQILQFVEGSIRQSYPESAPELAERRETLLTFLSQGVQPSGRE